MAPEGPLLVPSVGLLYRFICANLVIVVVDCARVPVDHGVTGPRRPTLLQRGREAVRAEEEVPRG